MSTMPTPRLIDSEQYTETHDRIIRSVFRSCLACNIVCGGAAGIGHTIYFHSHRILDYRVTVILNEQPPGITPGRYFVVITQLPSLETDLIVMLWFRDLHPNHLRDLTVTQNNTGSVHRERILTQRRCGVPKPDPIGHDIDAEDVARIQQKCLTVWRQRRPHCCDNRNTNGSYSQDICNIHIPFQDEKQISHVPPELQAVAPHARLRESPKGVRSWKRSFPWWRLPQSEVDRTDDRRMKGRTIVRVYNVPLAASDFLNTSKIVRTRARERRKTIGSRREGTHEEEDNVDNKARGTGACKYLDSRSAPIPLNSVNQRTRFNKLHYFDGRFDGRLADDDGVCRPLGVARETGSDASRVVRGNENFGSQAWKSMEDKNSESGRAGPSRKQDTRSSERFDHTSEEGDELRSERRWRGRERRDREILQGEKRGARTSTTLRLMRTPRKCASLAMEKYVPRSSRGHFFIGRKTKSLPCFEPGLVEGDLDGFIPMSTCRGKSLHRSQLPALNMYSGALGLGLFLADFSMGRRSRTRPFHRRHAPAYMITGERSIARLNRTIDQNRVIG
ncbi:hypothetical protein LXA43DRAFT_1066515 [Ganoderma leucocontextum]|nr:hypothetical protein LXA43DRAFT_1066515 [Ganoderma leucocontextum]